MPNPQSRKWRPPVKSCTYKHGNQGQQVTVSFEHANSREDDEENPSLPRLISRLFQTPSSMQRRWTLLERCLSTVGIVHQTLQNKEKRFAQIDCCSCSRCTKLVIMKRSKPTSVIFVCNMARLRLKSEAMAHWENRANLLINTATRIDLHNK